jgi:hypothetical protein
MDAELSAVWMKASADTTLAGGEALFSFGVPARASLCILLGGLSHW